jgi:hypothetical protein
MFGVYLWNKLGRVFGRPWSSLTWSYALFYVFCNCSFYRFCMFHVVGERKSELEYQNWEILGYVLLVYWGEIPKMRPMVDCIPRVASACDPCAQMKGMNSFPYFFPWVLVTVFYNLFVSLNIGKISKKPHACYSPVTLNIENATMFPIYYFREYIQ